MTDLALAAMEADIEAIAKLETWKAKMQLDHDSKEYSLSRALRNRYVKKPSIRFWRFGIRNGRFWAIYLREIM